MRVSVLRGLVLVVGGIFVLVFTMVLSPPPTLFSDAASACTQHFGLTRAVDGYLTLEAQFFPPEATCTTENDVSYAWYSPTETFLLSVLMMISLLLFVAGAAEAGLAAARGRHDPPPGPETEETPDSVDFWRL
ncbi:MAG: hypothetical protein P8Z68_02725 [Kineosporiaceae bacterium]